MINWYNRHFVFVGVVSIEILLMILFWFVLSFYPINKNDFNKMCFARHGHIEMFEDGRVECKYPLNIP